MNRKSNLLTVSLLAGILTAYGQDTLRISRQEVLDRIAEQNQQVRIAQKNVSMAMADLHQTNAVFLPTVTASHTAISTNNPLLAFGSKLNQEIVSAADFDPSLLNDPDRIENYATELQVLMPLLNADGIYMRQAAKSKVKAYQLQEGRTLEHTLLEGRKAFMLLQLAYEAAKVLEKAYSAAIEQRDIVTNFYEKGLVPKTDLMTIQIRVSEVENQLQAVKNQIRDRGDHLSLLMGAPTGAFLVPAEGFSESLESELPVRTVPESRKDLAALAQTVEAYEKMNLSGKSALLPRVNAFGSYQWYDNTLFGTSANGYLVGARLSWDLFDGYKTLGKLEKSKAELEKVRLEADYYSTQSQAELEQITRQLTHARSQVETARLVLDQSQEVYRIKENRFKEGLEKTADLLTAETFLFQKELEYKQALFHYHLTKDYLTFLTR